MNNGRDCVHGRQVGKCDTCDLIDAEQRILELEAEVEQLQAKLQDEERTCEQVLDQRDSYHDWADQLANAIARFFGVDIGEHSSANNPWREALNFIPDQCLAEHDVKVIADAYEDYRKEYVGQGMVTWFNGYMNKLRQQAKEQ